MHKITIFQSILFEEKVTSLWGDTHSSRPKQDEDENDRASRFQGQAEECGLHTEGIEEEDIKPHGSVYNLSENKKHPTVVMVKKRMSDGEDCRRCKQIQERIEKDRFEDNITETIFVEEGKNDSTAAKLSAKFKMRTAPFFVVTHDDDRVEAVESYFKLKKMLKSSSS